MKTKEEVALLLEWVNRELQLNGSGPSSPASEYRRRLEVQRQMLDWVLGQEKRPAHDQSPQGQPT